MSAETVAFSPDQQAAVFGHVLAAPEAWARLQGYGGGKEWCQDPRLVALFDHVEQFQRHYRRTPNRAELEQFVFVRDPDAVLAVHKDLAWAVAQAATLQPDVLLTKIDAWARAREILQFAPKLKESFNKGELEEAERAILEVSAALHKIRVGAGGDATMSSADRFEREEAQRLEDARTILPWGVTFLDDLLGGITRRELVLVGAISGRGKTELAKIVSSHTSREHPTYGYFLEADEDEIERRLKFNMLAKRWRADNPGERRGRVSYANFMQARLEADFAPYKADVLREYRAKHPYFHTYYRKRSEFGLREMEREFVRAAKAGARLIILDHLHYMDQDAEVDDNRALKLAISLIRQLVIAWAIPCVVVVHLNKNADAKLIPAMADIHGSSDVSKISTTQVILGSAPDVSGLERPEGSPTLIRVTKSRLGGAALMQTGMAWFNQETGEYADRYAVGKLSFDETKWSPLTKDWPYWAKDEHLVRDLQVEG